MDDRTKRALTNLTYGLYIVTVKAKGVRNAMVVSWVSQVSFEPARIMVGIKKTRMTHALLESADGFGLMVVGKGKEGELSHFKGKDPEEKFEGREIVYGMGGAPLFTDSLIAFDLTIVERVDAGDHTVFIGEVLDVPIINEGIPAGTRDYKKVYIGES